MPARKPRPEHIEEEEEEEIDESEVKEDDDDEERIAEESSQSQQQVREDSDDSEGSSSSSAGKDEFIIVRLADIRKEVQCPICLGIIRKTRTVMECLHRFCRECIDKSMRLGNNECPACRTHCASRRSLRDDPNYDALIAALYPDIDKYEEEELAFHEEEKLRNKQIQASIAQTLIRQSEALSKRRTSSRTIARRSHGNFRNCRGRNRNHRESGLASSDDEEDANANDGAKDSFSSDDRFIEIGSKRRKRWTGTRGSPALGGDENEQDSNRDNIGSSTGCTGSPDVLVWGKGGTRSHTRYGILGGSNGKTSRNSRVSRMLEYFRNLDVNEEQSDIHFTLLPFDEQSTPTLQKPYICCRPSLSIRQLYEFISLHIRLKANDVEILVKRTKDKVTENSGLEPVKNEPQSPRRIKLELDDSELQTLAEHETLAEIHARHHPDRGNLVLLYRLKSSS